MYADKITGSMERAIRETNRRRDIQLEHNRVNKITPFTIIKSMNNPILQKLKVSEESSEYIIDDNIEDLSQIPKLIKNMEEEMKNLAKNLEFEKAAQIRDKIIKLKSMKSKMEKF
jgi:excinuclease ABC subunit B